MTKYLLFIVLFFSLHSYAQETIDSTAKTLAKTDSAKQYKPQHDTVPAIIDSNKLNSATIDSIPSNIKSQISDIKLKAGDLISVFTLNTSSPFQSNVISERRVAGKEILFYIIIGFLLFVGIFRAFYSKYLMNLFRVFFNTSLRQGQLTDILLQSRLSSLVFNIIFIFSSGIYAWLLLTHYNIIPSNEFLYLPLSIALILFIYLVKYTVIKFIGWISGLKDAASQYIFIIFLINKIIAFILLPFIVLIAFAPSTWLPGIILLSWLIMATLFLVRYFRSYGNLQSQLQVSPFHFLIYLAAIEIIPLFILYKSIFYIINNNPLT